MDWPGLREVVLRQPKDGELHKLYDAADLAGWAVQMTWPGYKTVKDPVRYPNDFYVRVSKPEGGIAPFDHLTMLFDFWFRLQTNPGDGRRLYDVVRKVIVAGDDPLTERDNLGALSPSPLGIPALVMTCAEQVIGLEEEFNYPKGLGRRMPLHYLSALLVGVPMVHVTRSAVKGYEISNKYLRDNGFRPLSDVEDDRTGAATRQDNKVTDGHKST